MIATFCSEALLHFIGCVMVTRRVFHVWVSTDTCNVDVIAGDFTKALPVILVPVMYCGELIVWLI